MLSSIKNELFSSKNSCDLVEKMTKHLWSCMTVLYLKVQDGKIKIPFKYPEK